MGSGVIDAGLLLENIETDGVGTDIKLPNVFVATGKTQTIDIMRCFDNGEPTTYSATSAHPAVATVEIDGKNIRVVGISAGSTPFTVTAGNETQTAIITVRKNVDDNGGWMR
jgi:uncharacterized protein YjdB